MLISVLGECRVEARARARGTPATDWELGVTIGQIRRVLSTSFVRAQSLCLLSRVCQLGPGARSAADRRLVVQRAEESRVREQRAIHEAHIRGRGASRVGEIFI